MPESEYIIYPNRTNNLKLVTDYGSENPQTPAPTPITTTTYSFSTPTQVLTVLVQADSKTVQISTLQKTPNGWEYEREISIDSALFSQLKSVVL